MIFHYQPLVSWPFFFGILAILWLIGMASFYFQWKKRTKAGRIVLRMLFFFGFVTCLSLLVLRPQRKLAPQERQILVYEDGLDKATVDFWKDTLKTRRTVALSKYKPGMEKVILLGDNFDRAALYPLKDLDFQWILPERQGGIRALSWKGFLRKGEVQRLAFEVFSEKEKSTLAVSGAKHDSTSLKKGWNTGLLEFYPSGLGQAEFPLTLDKDTLVSVRFFIGAASPKKYHFQLGFPGAETRMLESWLREKGETVSEEIKLSRETVLQSGNSANTLQVLLVDPAQLGLRSVQDAVKSGNAALIVVNVAQPVETAKNLNRLFGTDFQVEQSTQNESRTLKNVMEALPYFFAERAGQKLLQERSIAIQYAGSSPVAMSLVSASYPLALQGKTGEYDLIWGELFGLLEPDESHAWRMEAPLLTGFSKELQLMADSLPEQLAWEADTLTWSRSPVNPYLVSGSLQVEDSTWVRLDSGFSVFAYGKDDLPSLQAAALIHEIQQSATQNPTGESKLGNPISPWIWMVGMLLFLGLLWLEPKLS
ncbi:hypothetical protein GCM10009119_33280 [Algoriphagus jejuensis]|uniref:Aerotolerance regulator N-terminal domain-containing protein n=1 Tax=Algoriphagus jejuensis TaxID=419934 RepID=A0ABN1N3G8_9BACT